MLARACSVCCVFEQCAHAFWVHRLFSRAGLSLRMSCGAGVCARVLQHLVYQSSALHALVRADADSDDGDDVGDDEEQEERAALIRQNALMVGQCGKTLLPGAWRGCAKSPL